MEKSGDETRDNVKLIGRTARERLRNVSRKPQAIAPRDVVAAFNGRPLSVAVGNTCTPDTANEVHRLLKAE